MRWLQFIFRVALLLCVYLVVMSFAFGAQPTVVVSPQTGFPQSTSYSILTSPVLYDLDGDGDMEVVVVSERTIYVYDKSGTLLWSEAAGIVSTALQNAPVVGDLDGDGKGEVITFGFLESNWNLNYYNYLYAFNSTNEKFHLTTGSNYNYNGWQYEMNAKPGSPAFIDLDNDGIDEIVVATAGNAGGGDFKTPPALFAFDDSSRLWYQTLPSPTIRTTASAVGDVNNDGSPDVIVILDGSDDVIAYSVDGSGATELWRTGITTSSYTTRTAAIGDVYGDVNNEVIVAADNGVFVLKGTDGSVIWNRVTDPINYSSPVIGDIDNDGSNEIVVGSVTGNVYALNGNNGADMSNFPVSTGRDIWSTPALVDLDGDGKKEIIVGCWDGNVYAWHSDGTMVNGFPIVGTSVITSSPVVADIDNDGNFELAIGADDYKVYVWDLYVIHPPIVIIDSPMSGTFLNGESISFDGSNSYDDNSISSYEWSSSIDGILSTSQSFSISSLSLGDHTVTLEVTDNENAVNSSSISIYINNPPTVVIDSPVDGNVTVWNDDTTFNCTALDTDGTIASYEWVSDINGTIGTLNTFTTSSLMPGIHNIVLTVTDNKGTSVTDSISINVNIPPVVSINSPNQSSIFDYGESITFNGTATDDDGTIAAYSWISDKDGLIGNSDVITTSGLTSGIHNIVFSASDNSSTERSTSLQIKVNEPPESKISGGGGGGGGNTGEEYENIESKDVKKDQVNKGIKSSYEFESIIEAVEFTGKTNAGAISVTIEELHHTSVHVNNFVDGKVYKNINIYVGNAGYATENNIEDAVVKFSVEKAWIKENNINKYAVRLNRYHDDKWNPLDTKLLDEDDSHLYYSSKTPGFSPFSITGTEKVIIPPVLPSDVMSSDVFEQAGTLDEGQNVPDETETANRLPAFKASYALLAFGIVAVVVIVRKKFGLK